MSLFRPTSLTPEEREARAAEIKARHLAGMRDRLASLAAKALKAYDEANRAGIAAIFDDPRATPQEIVEALGTDATALLQGSSSATAHLAQQYAIADTPYTPPVFPEGLVFTFNPDGSASVTIPE